MLNKTYKAILYTFLSYVLLLNFLTFLSSGSPKALINPFYIKNRTISMYHLTKHVVMVAGLGFVTSERHEVDAFIQTACEKYGVDPKLIHMMIQVESKGRQFAISRTGAMGLMQVMPTTFFDISQGDPFLAEDNIDAGVKYLSRQLKKFEDIPLALAAYNAGPNNIKDGKVPDFGETRHYIKKIMELYEK
ncbi:lytic transglycosylase domain-containing protein [Seleniivibrio woodruffii]|uniref:Transglycosylase-like protein with SLT domain n=1 Tax=Seleniivibrio woodruffii TaxID=1078050 RepID=A0A4R1KDK1_9BACT|nr:lytic transglycosylase domain-containing protein [Seleniivibrio woodruffii]TCK62686.1 transglycosylase-like protein with SLT domain [Seleniivibrio woodruffii]TVZ36889.1 transglycosylase-like protein with SLT domain [Seleniivibrio woodruffii]